MHLNYIGVLLDKYNTLEILTISRYLDYFSHWSGNAGRELKFRRRRERSFYVDTFVPVSKTSSHVHISYVGKRSDAVIKKGVNDGF